MTISAKISRQKWKRTVVLGVGIVTVLWLCAYAVGLRERLLFCRLQISHADSDRTQEIARQLGRSKLGLRLAAEDMNVFGGSTGGYSSWILEYSELDAEAKRLLEDCAAQSASPGKQLEAFWILWRRTGDPQYLRSLFRKCRKKGPPAIRWARINFSAIFNDPSRQARLDLPADRPLDIAEEEFESWLQDAEPPQ